MVAESPVVEGLWLLADECDRRGDYLGSIKCLDSVIDSGAGASLLPLSEARTRLRLASLLLDHTHNIGHARNHLERAHLLLSSVPSALPLKLRAHSLLSHCYHLSGAIPAQRHLLLRALAALDGGDGESLDPACRRLWSCNLRAQLAGALAVDGEYPAAIAVMEEGFVAAGDECPDLRFFFAASQLHLHLLHWEDSGEVASAASRCSLLWDGLPSDSKEKCVGLFFYHELLHTFYLLRLCDYKGAQQHINKLDAAMAAEQEKAGKTKQLASELEGVNQSLSKPGLPRREKSGLTEKQRQLQEQLKEVSGVDCTNGVVDWPDQLDLAPPPFDGEWLPRSAVFALVDLVVVMAGRPKGVFKECGRRIQSGMQLVHEELLKLGIDDNVNERNLQKSAIWISGVYLTLLMQFLENKVAVELTRSEFVEAQDVLVQMKKWFLRFPTILQGCGSIIEMLRGQYAHSVGCYDEAAFHFIEATKLTVSSSMQSMCNVYAAVSYICTGDPESSSMALELVGPVYKMMDSFVGVREKTCVIFAYGLLLMRQQNLQEARVRLASGLKLVHQQLGNIQLVSQYLTVLGSLALQLHDTGQAREILKSSLTLAKTLYDVPTQIWVLSVLTALYQELGEKSNEIENSEYEGKKEDDLQKKLTEARSSSHHHELIGKTGIGEKIALEIKRGIDGPYGKVDLDIPESIGLPTPSPATISSKLRDVDAGIRPRRKRAL